MSDRVLIYLCIVLVPTLERGNEGKILSKCFILRIGMKDYLLSKSILVVYMVVGLLSSQLYAGELPDFTKLVEQYGPAVVNISTTKTDKAKHHFRDLPKLPEDSPFGDFLRRFFDQGNDLLEERPPMASLGSGFIISSDGYIVTNRHVVKNSDEIVVRLTDRREFDAKLIGADKRSDIALLKVEATGLPTVKLGSSSKLKVGEWVLAIGSPFGFEQSVTAGIISALGRSLPNDTYVPFIQTDAAINPGNSGGPLFNLNGEVIGVNSQIYSRTGGFMGLSFAVPVDIMKTVVEQLKTRGKVSRGWLGVLIQDVTAELAESFGMEKPQGALIAKVLPDSPAAKAGFKVGDIIISFDGKHINRSSELPPIVGSSRLGSPIDTLVIRKGKTVTIKVTLGELPSEEDIELAFGTHGKGNHSLTSSRLGLSVINLDQAKREQVGVTEGGVLVQRVEAGPARDAGIRKDDVIIMVDNVEIKDVNHFMKVVSKLTATTVPVLVHRNGSPLFLALRLPAK